MKVVYLAIDLSAGHLNPIAPILVNLVSQRQVTLTVFGDDLSRQMLAQYAVIKPYRIENQVLSVTNVRNHGSQPDIEGLKKIFFGFQSAMPYLLEDIRQIAPDVIMYDTFMLFVAETLSQFSVPQIAVHTTQLKALKATHSSPFFSSILSDPLKKESFFFGTKSIVTTTRAVHPPCDEIHDPRVHFVGATISKRNDSNTLTPLIEKLKLSPKVIYVAMGSVLSSWASEFYQKIIKALEDFEGTVVISAGNSATMLLQDPVKPHINIFKSVPQLEVLEQTDIFIFHGGWNSVNESLYFGVPMILIPQLLMSDQPLNAEYLESIGAGIHLPKNNITETAIYDSVNKIMNEPSYKNVCHKLSESYKEHNAVVEGANIVVEAYQTSKQ